ncbi:opine dehydrogenase-like [Mercenaria mercenaria]|uniref:opine dehydrogenase-like n=1 Tax=Mercenaria mercenaria TaxID=6596 RepID=UPI00234EFF41|nr:opine dehydrogenase-like [Mercenaria mercenaria]XP_045205351.2 opine dehydrogenase-like [Mercenaria mercenaria]
MARFSEKVNVTICGGGNGAHTLAGLSSLVENANVTVIDVYEDEAERWTETMKSMGFTVKFSDGESLYQKPGEVKFRVSRDVKSVVPKSDILIICVPAYTHETYLNLVSPYVPDACPVIGMPGQPGFEYQALTILKENDRKCTVMSVETLPWACRISKYGQEVDVVGTKEEVRYTLVEKLRQDKKTLKMDPASIIQTILGQKPKLYREKNILKYTFLCIPTIHPPIMYARWRNWDGKPLNASPLFYQGADEDAVKYMNGVTDESIEIAIALTKKVPDQDFSVVSTMQEWLLDHYTDQITDKRSLFTCLKTNKAYDGLLHPTTKTSDGKYVPDLTYRYVREDVPYGLIVIRQIAEMVGVETPVIDEIILWAQEKLGKEYLKDGKLCKLDRENGRLPLTYGIRTIEEFVSFFA